MASSPRDGRSRTGYLVATPPRRERAPRIIALLAVAVVVLAAAGFAGALLLTGGQVAASPSLTPRAAATSPVGTTPAPDTGPTTAVVGERTMALEKPDAGAPIGRVLMFADRGQDAATTVTSGDAVALTRAGWAVAAFDGAGSDYGSPASQTATADLLNWSAEQVPTGPLVIVTYGTGAATALSGIALADAEPTCWASSQPITDLVGAAIADPAIEGEITAAWGGVPAQDQLPRAYVAELPTATSYRILAPAASAPQAAREDAASLVSALEESGHDVTTVELGAARADLLTALRGCEA